MASFKSVLSDIGNALKKFFTVADNVANAAEPFVDQLFPGIAPLYNLVLAEVGKAEAAAIAAGSQSGSGAQKLALVVQAVLAQFPEYTTQQLMAVINGVVAGLNALPTLPNPPAAATPTP